MENSDAKKWKSNRSSTDEKKSKTIAKKEKLVIAPATKKQNYKQVIEFIKRDFKKIKRTKIPSNLQPMLATLIDEPFNGEDWLFEIKWDGYRSISYVNNGVANIRSRSNLSFNNNYPPVADALEDWGINVVVDGEIVVLNEEGKTEFNALQNWSTTREGNLFYYVFDVLWLDAIDLTHEPLYKRKEVLKKIIPENGIIRYSDDIDCQGVDFFDVIKNNGLEGMVGKRKDSIYLPGVRTKDWLKLPVEEEKEYVIVGYTESEANRPFSRIMFGNYGDDGKLYYVHHSGGGISDELLHSTYQRLKKLEVKKKPVVNDANEDTPIHWVKPKLIGRFREKSLKQTPTGRKRHPVIFLGLREDIRPEEVMKKDAQESGVNKKAKAKNDKKFSQQEVWKRIHGKEIAEETHIKLEGKDITIINFKHPYWTGITKYNVIEYYTSISDYLLPYLKDRPLGLKVVKHWAGEEEMKGVDGNFLRNMKGNYPSWIKTFTTNRKHKVQDKSEDIDWVVCNDVPTLLYLLNLGALDFHPWAARIESSDYPDYIIVDLDPSKGSEKDKEANTKMFQLVIKVALAAKKWFDEQGLTSFIKTSGKTGMHLLLPCKGIKYGESRPIAEIICKAIHDLLPKISTLNKYDHGREGKVYIDASQNDYSDRLVAPYCLRAYMQPYVSAPLEWSEVNIMLKRNQFTIHTMADRLNKAGDLFKDLFNEEFQKQNSKILKQMLSANTIT